MLLAPLLALPVLLTQEAAAPDALELARTATLYLPEFGYEPTAFLDERQERDLRVARLLFDASLLLDERLAFAHRFVAHTEALLAEDAGNRGHAEQAREHRLLALESLDRAIELEPTAYWPHYARGTALAQLDRYWEAIASYDQAEILVEDWLDTVPDAERLHYFLRRWRADTRMRTLELDRARVELRAFHEVYGTAWSLARALAETHVREGSLARAREAYEDILATEEYRTEALAYEQLGNLVGLLGDDEQAVRLLRAALEHERRPGFYNRLWLWILASGEPRAEARGELEEFLRFPPSHVSEWDVTLGRFLLGVQPVEDFLAAARAESERRSHGGEPQGDLLCEAWFYAGLRLEEDATRRGTTPVLELLQGALDAYRQALAFRPRQTKWEWEWARLRFARLARELGREPRPGFRCEERELLLEDTALHGDAPVRRGRLELVLRHAPGDERGTRSLGELGGAPLIPGEVVRCVVLGREGHRHALTLVVDAAR